MKINMSIQDNFSSLIDEESGLAIFVDSFDNHEFDVRIGSVNESVAMGSITANNDAELNEKIASLLKIYKEKQ
jgi:hypothetical protein